jgi:predicted permease
MDEMLLLQDLRFAFRQLRKTPAFTAVVLATLALCIGINAAVFSVLDAVLLKTLPYSDPNRLALLVTAHDKGEINDSQTGALFEAVRDGAALLEIAAYSGHSGVNFASGGRAEFVQQQRVSTGFFRVLGVPPQYGREFTPAEDGPGGPAVAILGHEFWQRVFQGDPGAVGKAIQLRGEPYTVIGVMPSGFRSTSPADLWTPLRPTRTGEGAGSNYGVVAHLKPGDTWAAANQQLKAVSEAVKSTPGFPREYRDFEEQVVPLQQALTGDSRSQLLLTWGAVLVVLVIGCVNIAGLMLARSGARHREVATRMAVGASRFGIVRQLLVESVLLSLGGCAIGIALGVKALDWLKVLGADRLEMLHPIALDLRVAAAMLGIALLTALVFGLAPAVQTSRVDIRSVLVEGGRGMAGGRRHWSRNVLVAAEVALSLVLLVSAGLLVRTLTYLNGLNPGFEAHGVISAEASLQDARYQTSAAVNLLYRRTLDRIRAIPGVESAAVALTLPYERPLNDGFRALDGDDKQGHGIEVVYVTPGYFETMRIPLRQGRGIRETDGAGNTPVAVASEAFVRKYFAHHQAVGGHIRMEGATMELVGVAGDVQQHSGLGNFGPISVNPTLYVPVAQESDKFLQVIHVWFSPKWVIRTAGNAAAVESRVQAAVAAVDPLMPVAKFKTIDDLRGRITLDQRYRATLFSILAGLALLLAALGLSGLISQAVNERTHELGVRLALGANPGQAILTMVRPGLLLAMAGVAAGYGLSRIAAGMLEHLLWGVRPADPVTFFTTSTVLLLVAALASLAPALRILRIDPAQTLRGD